MGTPNQSETYLAMKAELDQAGITSKLEPRGRHPKLVFDHGGRNYTIPFSTHPGASAARKAAAHIRRIISTEEEKNMTNVPDLFQPQPEPTDLVKVDERDIGGVMQMTVIGRELHASLGAGKKFADWMRDRATSFGFVDGLDYGTYSQNGEKGRPTIEYVLSLDMAKQIAMVEKTEKGRQIRRYFIDCERKVLEATRHAATGDVGALFDLFSEDGQQARQMLDGLRNQSAQIEKNLAKRIGDIAGAVNGYEKHRVLPVIRDLAGKMDALTLQLAAFREASYERDRRILARAERSDTTTMREALELMQVPEEHRTPELSAFLTRQSAAVWFSDRGYRYLPSGGDSNRLSAEFELRRIPDWWEAKGKAAYERFFAKKGRRTVIRLATENGETVPSKA